jgi:uncharacterized membrane protein
MGRMWVVMLALTQNTQQDITSIVVFCIVLILAILLMWIVYALARRRFTKQEAQSSPASWSLNDIRKLRDEGQLSQEEYEKLRDIVAGRATPEERPAKPRKAPPNEDDEEGEIVWQAKNPPRPPKSDDENQSGV